jgi:hypothetical protein
MSGSTIAETQPGQRLPQAWIDRLRQRFGSWRAAYIAAVLTPGELAVVSDVEDALIIARIKRMTDPQLRHYERLGPITADDRRLYSALQVRWLRDEEYLLGCRLGRKPEHHDLFVDFMNNHNGLRFRAYFALKFPKRVAPMPRRKSK